MQCENEFQWFLDDISRYGVDGYERLLHIFPMKSRQQLKKHKVMIE